jgi:hypothetical protein
VILLTNSAELSSGKETLSYSKVVGWPAISHIQAGNLTSSNQQASTLVSPVIRRLQNSKTLSQITSMQDRTTSSFLYSLCNTLFHYYYCCCYYSVNTPTAYTTLSLFLLLSFAKSGVRRHKENFEKFGDKGGCDSPTLSFLSISSKLQQNDVKAIHQLPMMQNCSPTCP